MDTEFAFYRHILPRHLTLSLCRYPTTLNIRAPFATVKTTRIVFIWRIILMSQPDGGYTMDK